jgi:fatty-acyl-CoA synthase
MLSAAAGDMSGWDLPAVTTTVGGSPIPPDLLVDWQSRGWRMVPVYGASEAGSTIVAGAADDDVTGGATGRVMPRSAIRIVDRSGRDAEPGAVGEIWISGEALMSGYWGKPAETAAVLVDGWYRSGDAGSLDAEGRLRIVDRWKEMFISGAENVYPAEVEAVIYAHDDVLEVAVIGVADPKWGEVGHAFVVAREGSGLDAQALREWCLPRLAKYKIPAHLDFVPVLPKGGSGKVLKNELRARVADGH